MTDRHLDWPGCLNIRDLGGLPAGDGRRIRRGAVVRADSLDRLTPDGWAALHDYGVRTIVDLREDDEREIVVTRPPGISVVTVALDDNADSRFWYDVIDADVDGTPLYYGPFLARKADRCVEALSAIARAEPGSVVVHCGIGRDRTGLIALLLLALAGVPVEEIAADYALSGERLLRHFEDVDPVVTRLAERGTTIAEAMRDLLAESPEPRLRAAGLTSEDLAAIRLRLLSDG